MAERKSQSELIRRVWMLIRRLNNDKKPTNFKNLLSLLSKELTITAENLESELLMALHENLIINSNKASTVARMLFQIPKMNEEDKRRLEMEYDWYCYLCHTGENVIKCAKCLRAIHKLCVSQDDEEQGVQENQSTQQDQAAPVVRSASTNSEVVDSPNSSILCVDDTDVANDWLPFVVLKKERMKSEEIDAEEFKSFIQEDCQFVSVIRQPTKQKARDIKTVVIRHSTPDPDDIPLDDSAELDLSHSYEIVCQHCKLMNNSDKNQSPNVSISELNNLLGFLYGRIKPWINFAASPLFKLIAKDFQEVFKLYFLKFPVSLESIKLKLSSNSYKTLDEFYGDILDFHHCVAIIFGTKSKECHVSQQTKLECAYHISEIRACHDCYRHSNQLQNQSAVWFTEPCTIRHEVVFAKQIGFNYWPAKVLKVSNDDYDVRFFGPKHTRAIVSANCIKPIDTSLEELKITKKSTGFVKAMEELEVYQQRRLNHFNEDYLNIAQNNVQLNVVESSEYNTSTMSDSSTAINGITSSASKLKNNLQSNISKTSLRIRNKTTKEILNSSSSSRSSNRPTTTTTARSMPIFVANPKHPNRPFRNKSVNIDKSVKRTLDNFKTILYTVPMGAEVRKKTLRDLEQQVENLNLEFKTTINQVKKDDWCHVCGKTGKYLCCFVFYCSTECQQKHWDEEHASNCKSTMHSGWTGTNLLGTL